MAGEPAHIKSGLKNQPAKILAERPHKHFGWLCCKAQLVEMAERIKTNKCVVIYGPNYERSTTWPYGPGEPDYGLWCVTHECVEDYGHALWREGR